LKDLPLKLPVVESEREPVWHLFVIETDQRDELLQFLKDKEIYCGIHYPIPLHLQGAYQDLGYQAGDFPVAEKAAKRILSLPLHPDLTKEDVSYIKGALEDFFNKK